MDFRANIVLKVWYFLHLTDSYFLDTFLSWSHDDFSLYMCVTFTINTVLLVLRNTDICYTEKYACCHD